MKDLQSTNLPCLCIYIHILTERSGGQAWKGEYLSILLPDNLDQYTFAALAVELSVEDLLPGAKVEFPVGDGDHNLTAMKVVPDLSDAVP